MSPAQLSEFGIILLFIIGGIMFVAGGLITSWILRPRRPNEEKIIPYECGEDPEGNAWGNFNTRFYVIALIFILFEVEIVFLFPWATVFGQESLIESTNGLWGWFSLFEMFVFVGILIIGLAYAWVKGHLNWVKPDLYIQNISSSVPEELYEKINQKYATDKAPVKEQ